MIQSLLLTSYPFFPRFLLADSDLLSCLEGLLGQVPLFPFTHQVGWQLDPFGHSATQAALLSAEVGFGGLFFGRIDYQDLAHRLNHSSAEFVWQASESLGSSAQVM